MSTQHWSILCILSIITAITLPVMSYIDSNVDSISMPVAMFFYIPIVLICVDIAIALISKEQRSMSLLAAAGIGAAVNIFYFFWIIRVFIRLGNSNFG